MDEIKYHLINRYHMNPIDRQYYQYSEAVAKMVKQQCPICHKIYLSGEHSIDIQKCPFCNEKFMKNHNVDHGKNCSVCFQKYHGTNNVYYKDGCPALMDDGRFITYYNSSNELTETMRKMNGFRSANQFRTFMQANAEMFMAAERAYQIKENTCAPTTACSEGWYDLWTKKNGYWANNQALIYSLNH
uniref:Uncharacterized protein n=1 Tax=viral metagenome TaxID=1070528 RepID=A0A6C0LRK6_9ZZZZ